MAQTSEKIGSKPVQKRKIIPEDIVMKAIAILAPIPTAWMVGEGTYTLMKFPVPVAIAAALAVEGLGFVAVNTLTEMIEFNRHINMIEASKKMEAPVKQAGWLVVIYALTVFIMTVLLHVLPGLIVWAPIPFISLMICVGWLYALRNDQAARSLKWSEGRASASLQRRSAIKPASRATLPAKPAIAPDVPSVAPAKKYLCDCGFETENRFKFSGHQRTCKPHIQAIAGSAETLFKKVKVKK